MRVALGLTAIPAPISLIVLARSYTCTFTPACRSDNAAVSPPMPPPTMAIDSSSCSDIITSLCFHAQRCLNVMREGKRTMSPTREQARAAGFLSLLTAKKSARAAINTGQEAIPDDDCRDILYATTDGALWHHLLVERAWSDQRY